MVQRRTLSHREFVFIMRGLMPIQDLTIEGWMEFSRILRIRLPEELLQCGEKSFSKSLRETEQEVSTA